MTFDYRLLLTWITWLRRIILLQSISGIKTDKRYPFALQLNFKTNFKNRLIGKGSNSFATFSEQLTVVAAFH